MIYKHELIRLEAPAVLWRGVGALAAVITNTAGVDLEQKSFEGTIFNTLEKVWANNQRHGYSLLVCQDVSQSAGPAALTIIEPMDPDTKLNMYTRYLFPADPDTQSNIGYLAVLRGALDMKGSALLEVDKQQEAQLMAGMEMGTAKGTVEDLGELSGHLWQGMLHVAGVPNK